MFEPVSPAIIGLLIAEIGMLFAISMIIAYILKRLGVPAVLGFILGGLALGVFTGLQDYIFSPAWELIYLFITELALMWIGYSIGSDIDLSLLRNKGKKYGLLLVGEALGAFIVVTVGALIIIQDLGLAFILGAIAITTAPVSVVQILGEYKARGELSQTLLFIIAFDDILAILLVNVALSLTLSTTEVGFLLLVEVMLHLAWEIIVSVSLGVSGAILTIFVSKRLRLTDKTIYEWVFGAIFASVGIALLLNGSVLLTAFIYGMTLKTQDSCGDCREAVNTIEIIFVPIVILFFVLVGLEMNLGLILGAGGFVFIAIAYFLLRVLGKGTGVLIVGSMSKTDPCIWKNLPLTLVTQAGVAIGLAGLAFNQLINVGRVDAANLIINTVGVAVILGEIIGPLTLKKALFRSGEAFQKEEEEVAGLNPT